ncbi:proline-rich protein 5 isoform X2 [Dipodomys merriami]
MSSPSLSDLGKREPAADERGPQQRRACANATWNSIHSGVIAVFQRKGLRDQELFSLNEGVRQLLKTELGSFFTEYLQAGFEPPSSDLSLLSCWDDRREPRRPASLGCVTAWAEPAADERHGDPTRQDPLLRGTEAVGLTGRDLGFLLQRRAAYSAGHLLPCAGQGAFGASAGPAALPGRHRPQRAAGGRLGPRPRPRAARHRADAARAAGAQGVHESRGVTEDYLRLETLIQKVVSPYLGTYGLYSSGDAFAHSCVLEKRLVRRSHSGDALAKNPVVRSKSYNTPLLNPVAEHEVEGAAAAAGGGGSIRRHSVSEMTSCPEPQGFGDAPGLGPTGPFRSSPTPHKGPCPSRLYPPAQPPELALARGSPPTSSPETLVDRILESADSDSEGIFIDFGRGGSSGTSDLEGAGDRQSMV